MATGAEGRLQADLEERASSARPARSSLHSNGSETYDPDAVALCPTGAALEAPSQLARRSLDPLQARQVAPPRPSSITKPRMDSFALQHDGASSVLNAHTAGNVSSPATVVRDRSSSISTGTTVARSESSYQGPLVPSHPYMMYPQQSQLARTASTATSSTLPVPSERFYCETYGPAHPYMMYPQNTVVATEDTSDESMDAPIAVGFPGRNADYRRRLGPDGEEVADMIGPDGHTEQLPPYSLYSDEAMARKTRLTIQPPIPGAGGMGLATRNPEFASREDLGSPQSRQSSRSPVSISDNPETSLAVPSRSEKFQLKKWQAIARRRVCNIVPLWAIVLVAIVLVVFVIILGTVLALLKPKHPPKHDFIPQANPQSQAAPTTVFTTMTTTFDATPCTTMPIGLPTLATGTHGLSINAPTLSQSSCIMDSAQSAGWSCAMPQVPLEVLISGIANANPLMSNKVAISRSNDSQTLFQYGSQPPKLSHSQILSVVMDTQEPWRGPAWFFQMPYNKVVNLPERALSTTNTRRDMSVGLERRSMAQPGDKPWICYWNGTLLEFFIYVNQTSSSQSSAALPTGSTPHYGSGPDMLDAPPFPNVVKVEERRITRGGIAVSPYCVQQIIDEDGAASPLLNSTGQQVIIYLNETVSTLVPAKTNTKLIRAWSGFRRAEKALEERQSSADCECVWIVN